MDSISIVIEKKTEYTDTEPDWWKDMVILVERISFDQCYFLRPEASWRKWMFELYEGRRHGIIIKSVHGISKYSVTASQH